jgi:hypothetical protein
MAVSHFLESTSNDVTDICPDPKPNPNLNPNHNPNPNNKIDLFDDRINFIFILKQEQV